MQTNDTRAYIIKLVISLILSVSAMLIWAFEGNEGFIHNLQAKCETIISVETSDTLGNDSDSNNVSDETLSALKEQNEQLTAQIAKGEEYRQEAQRLQELLNLKDKFNITGISAHVIGKSSEKWDQSFTIDVGLNGGSFVGATICASYGVVGQVISATENTSKVRLLTDPQSGVSAIVQSNRATCIVKGSLDGLLTAENIAQNAEIKEGDIIITSGLGGSFTKGIIIGTVVRVNGNASDGTLQAVLKQNDTTTFEEVIIVSDAAGEKQTTNTSDDAQTNENSETS